MFDHDEGDMLQLGFGVRWGACFYILWIESLLWQLRRIASVVHPAILQLLDLVVTMLVTVQGAIAQASVDSNDASRVSAEDLSRSSYISAFHLRRQGGTFFESSFLAF